VVAADPAAWRAAGFEVSGSVCEVGTVRLRLAGAGAGRGLLRWSVRGLAGSDLDGLPTEPSERPPPEGGVHPNGAVSLDHVVVFSPDLDRTVHSLRTAGLAYRRLREGPTRPGGPTRQAFFRMGEVVLEAIEAPEGSPLRGRTDAPARLWGLAFLVHDLDRAGRELGEHVNEPRDAIQPGRMIATVRREAGLGPAVAFMTPGPGAA